MTRALLVLATLAALGATASAAMRAPAPVLAWLGAIAAASIGAAAARAAADLHASADLREPRHARGPSHPEPLPADAVTRRGLFDRFWVLAAAAFGVLAATPFVALARRRAPAGTAWRSGARLVDGDGNPMRFDRLAPGSIETVFPEHAIGAPESATLLVRLEGDAPLRFESGRAAWIARDNVAYSKICTHAGCPVAIYRQTSHELYCPCHQSVFDVLAGAAPVSGPATRALPQLELGIDPDGFLIARGDYRDPVGPDQWFET